MNECKGHCQVLSGQIEIKQAGKVRKQTTNDDLGIEKYISLPPPPPSLPFSLPLVLTPSP